MINEYLHLKNVLANALYLGNKENPYLILVKAKNREIEICNIHRLTKSINDKAFYYCTSLKEINIPDSVVSIGSPDKAAELLTENRTTYWYCTK